jgi:hypothetical protein
VRPFRTCSAPTSRALPSRISCLLPIALLLAASLLLTACASSSSGAGSGTSRSSNADGFCQGRQPPSDAQKEVPSVFIELSSTELAAGGHVQYRIINERASAIAFTLRPSVQVWQRGRWRSLRITEGGVPVLFGNSATVLAGSPAASSCQDVPVSAEWQPGRYRLRQPVTAKFGGGRRSRIDLTAAFSVRAP